MFSTSYTEEESDILTSISDTSLICCEVWGHWLGNSRHSWDQAKCLSFPKTQAGSEGIRNFILGEAVIDPIVYLVPTTRAFLYLDGPS